MDFRCGCGELCEIHSSLEKIEAGGVDLGGLAFSRQFSD